MISDKILKNRNCFITGATGGIGKNIAAQMASAGCNLFLTSTNSAKLKSLKNKLQSEFGKSLKVIYEAGDLNCIGNIENIISKAREGFGSVDILINCAGVFPVKFLESSEWDDFDACFNVNVRAPFFLAKAFSTGMKKRKWGRIVNIGSSSAYLGFKETALYCASKHALLGLSRALFDELKQFNVRTFCVSPGAVKTKMGRKIKNQNFNTFLEPEEIAKYIKFIISFNGGMVSEEIRLNRVIIE